MGKGKLQKTLLGHTREINRIELTKNENILLSYSDKEIKIWDINGGKLLSSLEVERNSYFKLTKDEKKVITYSDNNHDVKVKIWDLENGKLLKSIERPIGIFYAYTANEKKLISLVNKTIEVWDMENGKLLKSLEGHTKEINAFQLTKDEKKIISYSDDKTIRIWDLETDNY